MALNFEKRETIILAEGITAGTKYQAKDIQMQNAVAVINNATEAKLWSEDIKNYSVDPTSGTVTIPFLANVAQWKGRTHFGLHLDQKVAASYFQRIATMARWREFTDFLPLQDEEIAPANHWQSQIEVGLNQLERDRSISILKKMAFAKDSTKNVDDFKNNIVADVVNLGMTMAEGYNDNTKADEIINKLHSAIVDFQTINLPAKPIKGIRKDAIKLQIHEKLAFAILRAKSQLLNQIEVVKNGTSVGMTRLLGHDTYVSADVRPGTSAEDWDDNLFTNTYSTGTVGGGVAGSGAQNMGGGTFKTFRDTSVGLQTVDHKPVCGFIGIGLVGIAPFKLNRISLTEVDATGDKALYMSAQLSGDLDGSENGMTILLPEAYKAIIFTDTLT